MHELSIALSIVETVVESLAGGEVDGNELPTGRIAAVHLRLGHMSGVARESLEFCYDVAIEGTPLDGSRLVVHDLPVVVYCAECDDRFQLESLQLFCCPRCGAATRDICQGLELEVESVEWAD